MKQALVQENAASLPQFTPQGGRGSGTDCMIDIKNEGASVRRVSVSGPPGAVLVVEPEDYFPTGRTGQLALKGQFAYPFTIEFRFLDTRNRERQQRYEMLKPFSFILTNET